MDIQIKEKESKGYAIAKEDSKKAGLMTFSKANSNLIIIDHTEVETEFRGQQVGKLMLYKIVDMAREKDVKILPLCPFVKAMFKKLDDISDVLK